MTEENTKVSEVAPKIQQMYMMKRSQGEICTTITSYLLEKYNFATVTGKKCKEIYVYKDGIFIEKGKDVIESECEQVLGSYAKVHLINEIRSKIERLTIVNREDLRCKDTNLLCLRNGVLDLDTMKLHNHSHKYRFIAKLPLVYNKDAHCIKILEFLADVLKEKDIEAIQEWFGFMLVREYFLKKAVIIRGEKDTGKTTFINLAIKFIGEENISTKSMQKLSEGKWQTAALYKKHANIADDLTADDVYNGGVFKQITGRSPVDGEEKFGDSFTFINFAKLMFACNRIPRINNDIDDNAFWDRWMIFDFTNVFNAKDKNTNFNKLQDIASEEELSGLLNWAIIGLKRLQKQGYFSYHRDWEINKSIMQGESSNIARFVFDCCESCVDNWISNVDFYERYVEFCRLNSITKESEQKFFKDVRSYCDYAKFSVQNKEGKRGVKDIKVRDIIPLLDADYFN